MSAARPGPAVVEALRMLDVRHLVLGIHDASFPSDEADDTGRGTPCSPAGEALAAYLRRLGFDGLQLGPQGLTAEDDPSPYAGALFSRDPLSVSLARLADPEGPWCGLLPARRLAALVARRPADGDTRVPYGFVHRAHRAELAAAFAAFEERRQAGDADAQRLDERLQAFSRARAVWLEPDALYEVLRGAYGGRDFAAWKGPQALVDRALGGRLDDLHGTFAARRAELARTRAESLRLYRFVQLVAAEQHAAFRERCRELGLSLYGDLQVGISPRDAWRIARCLLPGYRLGAPPSRTNPEGQPWHYPVLDPDAYLADGEPGPVLRFVDQRLEKTFDEYDAVRIDHPQGLVCPWVYREDDADPLRAVKEGARLFSSPDLPDHPALARFAIASRDQLTRDPAIPRHADGWVVALHPDQVDRYALLLDRVAETARRRARGRPALVCEVLSTLPHPLARVLERHDLGRFRVTQKARLGDENDVYRADRAEPHDWVMFGNHDTPPLWQLLPRWGREGALAERARHAARVLEPREAKREGLASELLRDPQRLAHAEIAQLFASPARNVMIYATDLLGIDEALNRPGTTGGDNWRMRLPRDWRERYEQERRAGRALDLRRALAMALRARPGAEALAEALEEEARGGPRAA